MEKRHIETVLFIGLLAGVLVLAFAMLRPFVNTLFLAAVLAFLFFPTQRRLSHALRSPSWSAFLITLLVLITILIPLALAGYQIAHEAAGIFSRLRMQTDPVELIRLTDVAQSWITRIWPGAQLDPSQISGVLQQAIQWLLAHTGTLFAGFGRLALHFVFLLLFFYYLVRDGKRLSTAFQNLLPMTGTHRHRIIRVLGSTVSGTVRGSVLIAVLQGLMAGLGFWLFGIPNPALWAGVIVIVSFVPILGTTLVQIPAITYLVITGHLTAAIGLAIWAATAVGMLDNFLGPRLIGQATRLHPLVAMVGVLGGITVFGPIGILAGPVVMAFLIALLGVYRTASRTAAR